MKDLEKDIRLLITPLLAETSVDVVDIKINRQGSHCIIEILADKPTGGITLQECASLNKKISHCLEEENLIKNFSIAVSSPGLDRPLKTKKDFMRVLHRQIRFSLIEPLEKHDEYIGVINKVEDEQLIITCAQNGERERGQSDFKELVLPMKNVKKAVQII